MDSPGSEQLAARGAYTRAFVRTVLRLNGVSGAPTEDQLNLATLVFSQYEIRVTQARRVDLAADRVWLQGRMPEQAAIEHAFLYVRFDSVMNTTSEQSIALHSWLNGN